jgi:Spy/CpxP family protein refolding chaperone
MRTNLGVALLTLVSAIGVAQGPSTMPAPGVPGGGEKHVMVYRREMGAWWKNSKIAEKLNLTDAQIKQLEDTFYQHKLKLIDIGAAMEKSDMKLQQMLDADTVDESAVNAQVDQVLAARGQMEREFTTMNLNFRKILTPEQWKQLRSIQADIVPGGDHMFFRQRVPGPGKPEMGISVGPGGPQSELEMEALPLPEGGADCATSESNGMKIVECTKKITIRSDTENKL